MKAMFLFTIAWLPLLLVVDLSSAHANERQAFCGTLAVAHRGNSLIAPENTIAAISAAAGSAHVVEFDVRQCATGELVVIHDSTVDRTTDGTGQVAELSLTELQSLDAGSWFSSDFIGERIPTLAEALLSLPPGIRPLIHRYTGSAATYLAELDALDVQGVMIQSFCRDFLATVRSRNKEIPLAVLGTGLLTNETINEIKLADFDIVAWRRSDVDTETVGLTHDAGLALFVWTVNDSSAIEASIAIDVDGIISDDPASVFQRSAAWYITGDANMDARVDLDDHRVFMECVAGPTQAGCEVFDFDCDGDLDLYDFARMANAF